VADRLADLFHHKASASCPASLTDSNCHLASSSIKKQADKLTDLFHYKASAASSYYPASLQQSESKCRADNNHLLASSSIKEKQAKSDCCNQKMAGGGSGIHLRSVHCPSTLDCSWTRHHKEGRPDGRELPDDGPLSEREFKAVVAAMQALHGV
jgi:hypothetical protein